MKRVFGLFLLLGMITMACVTTNKSQKNKMVYGFVLQETKCFGKCPVYELVINENGEATLEGEMNIDLIGNYKRTLSKEEFAKLTTAFETANFFAFQDEYKSRRTDAPKAYLSFIKGEKQKKISLQSPYPKELKELKKMLYALVLETDKWEQR
ncbi:MAG: hypothetical protein GY827_03210 [Cytophagales bacterium]|nr:hypothetical protein [Cytophagales bacterium]